MEQLAFFISVFELLGNAFEFVFRLGLALGPLGNLGVQFGQALGEALTALGHVANTLFQAADFQRSLGHGALCRVQGIARCIVPLTQRFELGLTMAQVGHA